MCAAHSLLGVDHAVGPILQHIVCSTCQCNTEDDEDSRREMVEAMQADMAVACQSFEASVPASVARALTNLFADSQTAGL